MNWMSSAWAWGETPGSEAGKLITRRHFFASLADSVKTCAKEKWVSKLPAGTKPRDFVTSLKVAARKPPQEDGIDGN